MILSIVRQQGLLKGDLNALQHLGLLWLNKLDLEKEREVERIRAINTGLVTNPHTAGDFIEKLISENEKEDEDEIEWRTPQSPEEIEEFLRSFNPS